MIIENIQTPGATLPEDRQLLLIDGRGCLILSKNDFALKMIGQHKNLSIYGLHVVSASRMRRFRRFWVFAKAAWKFSKDERMSA